MDRRAPAQSFRLFERQAGVVEPALVEIVVPPVRTCGPDHLGHGVSEQLEAILTLSERLLGQLATGDVPSHGLEGVAPLRVRDKLHVLAEPEGTVVGTQRQELEVRRRDALLELAQVERLDLVALRRVHEQREALAEDLVLPASQDAQGRGVDEGEATVAVRAVDDVSRLLHQRAVTRFAPVELPGAVGDLRIEVGVQLLQLGRLPEQLFVAARQDGGPASHGPGGDHPARDEQQQHHGRDAQHESDAPNLAVDRCLLRFLERGIESARARGVDLLLHVVLSARESGQGRFQLTLTGQPERLVLELDEGGVGGVSAPDLRGQPRGCHGRDLQEGAAQHRLEGAVPRLPAGVPGGGGHPRGHREDLVEMDDGAMQLLDAQVASVCLLEALGGGQCVPCHAAEDHDEDPRCHRQCPHESARVTDVVRPRLHSFGFRGIGGSALHRASRSSEGSGMEDQGGPHSATPAVEAQRPGPCRRGRKVVTPGASDSPPRSWPLVTLGASNPCGLAPSGFSPG